MGGTRCRECALEPVILADRGCVREWEAAALIVAAFAYGFRGPAAADVVAETLCYDFEVVLESCEGISLDKMYI